MIHPPSKPFLALMPDMTSHLFPYASHPHTRTQIHLSGSVHIHETAMNVHHSQNSPPHAFLTLTYCPQDPIHTLHAIHFPNPFLTLLIPITEASLGTPSTPWTYFLKPPPGVPLTF